MENVLLSEQEWRMVVLKEPLAWACTHTLTSSGSKGCFYFSFLCLMNMHCEEIWQEKNGAYKNILNSL